MICLLEASIYQSSNRAAQRAGRQHAHWNTTSRLQSTQVLYILVYLYTIINTKLHSHESGPKPPIKSTLISYQCTTCTLWAGTCPYPTPCCLFSLQLSGHQKAIHKVYSLGDTNKSWIISYCFRIFMWLKVTWYQCIIFATNVASMWVFHDVVCAKSDCIVSIFTLIIICIGHGTELWCHCFSSSVFYWWWLYILHINRILHLAHRWEIKEYIHCIIIIFIIINIEITIAFIDSLSQM